MDKTNIQDKPIGFFDSGVGGLSVLKQAISILPRENFIYFGDSKNAPYGVKTVEEVKELTINAVEFFLKKGVKAVVIACNTATSAAIEDLRDRYVQLPIIGIEPALKPAVELRRRGKIIIMATSVTLAEKKFNALVQGYGKEADIVPLPCPGLVELIESGIVEGKQIHDFLMHKLDKYTDSDIASIVLGCTHYPFVKGEISKIVGGDVPILDGSMGTAKQLRRQLLLYGIISERTSIGEVEILNSSENKEIIDLSYRLLEL